jgi:hypothetical protein
MRSALDRAVFACVFLVSGASAVACGGSTPPAQSTPPPSAEPPAPSASNDANRPLTKDECQSLGEWVAQACQTRPNERSARVDGWCTEVTLGVDKGSWQRDCRKHIRFMDSACFKSTTKVHSMMDCDKVVDRSDPPE